MNLLGGRERVTPGLGINWGRCNLQDFVVVYGFLLDGCIKEVLCVLALFYSIKDGIYFFSEWESCRQCSREAA